jgi:hypothetical protein
VLGSQEQQQFMAQLVKLVDVNNTLSRAPLRMPGIVALEERRPAIEPPVAVNGLQTLAQRGRMKGRGF